MEDRWFTIRILFIQVLQFLRDSIWNIEKETKVIDYSPSTANLKWEREVKKEIVVVHKNDVFVRKMIEKTQKVDVQLIFSCYWLIRID